jgi:hypothetical protein
MDGSPLPPRLYPSTSLLRPRSGLSQSSQPKPKAYIGTDWSQTLDLNHEDPDIVHLAFQYLYTNNYDNWPQDEWPRSSVKINGHIVALAANIRL